MGNCQIRSLLLRIHRRHTLNIENTSHAIPPSKGGVCIITRQFEDYNQIDVWLELRYYILTLELIIRVQFELHDNTSAKFHFFLVG